MHRSRLDSAVLRDINFDYFSFSLEALNYGQTIEHSD